MSGLAFTPRFGQVLFAEIRAVAWAAVSAETGRFDSNRLDPPPWMPRGCDGAVGCRRGMVFLPGSIALGTAADPGGADPIYECRLTYFDGVRPADVLTCGNRGRRLVPSAGDTKHGQPENARSSWVGFRFDASATMPVSDRPNLFALEPVDI